MTGVAIREARSGDHAAIRKVELEAFRGDGEADLVEALRASGDVVLELVAEWVDEIVGHILFSRLMVASGKKRFPAVALAPLAVLPDTQGKGIGSLLVIEAHCRLMPREKLSVVLGEPAYYGHFGYTHARAAGFESDYQGEALQALAWGDGPFSGQLVYAAPFAGL